MPQFYDLTVTALHRTTRDAVVVSLAPPQGVDFSHQPGQYLTFKRDFDGVELRRSYSICCAPGDGLQVGIKRVDGGAFSTWANTELAVGDVVQAMAPMGNFHGPALGDAPHILAIAAGSGITPVLSILATTLRDTPGARATLIYGNRTVNSVMFRAALADLKDTHMGRFSLINIMSDPAADPGLFQGRIDGAKIAALCDGWVDVDSVDRAYVCGPSAMMDAVSQALVDHGMGRDQIRAERFASAQPGRAKAPAPGGVAAQGTTARVILNGDSRDIPVAPGQSLLEAAKAGDIDPPFACCAGVCSTCKAKLTDGTAEMAQNHALEDYEVDQGFVLTCQAVPTSARVTVDYDQAGH